MEVSPQKPPYSLSAVSPFSLSPKHTTDPPAVSLLSDWQHLLLVPFLPSSEGKSLREVMRRQSPELGLAPACLLGLSSQPGDPASPEQEAPSAKRPPEPCFSKWAKELKRTSHPWQLKSITACLQDSGSEGRLGNWPRSLSCSPMFLFGERDWWLSVA